MRLGLYSSITIATLMCFGEANAAPPQLKGQYAFTGMATCQFSGQPFSVTQPPTITPPDSNNITTHTTLFTVPLNATPNGVFSNTFSVVGVRTFNGDGTGHLSGRSVEITNVSAQPRVGASRFEADFTYTIDNAGLLTAQLAPGTFKATDLNLDGSDSASTWTIDNFSLAGLVGNDNAQVIIGTVSPEIETQTFTAGPQTGTSRQRVCARSRVLTRLQP